MVLIQHHDGAMSTPLWFYILYFQHHLVLRNHMIVKKEDVLKWLDDYNHSRDWLADQCQVARGTVNNWLVSPRPIPAKAMPIIASLMATDEERERVNKSLPQNLVLELSIEDFNAICDRAIKAQQRPNKWAEDQLRQIANEDLDDLEIRLAAEDPAPYSPKKPSADVPEAS